jgi:hypothetical protein
VRYQYQNASGKQIAEELHALHNVEIREETIYAWLKGKSPDFVKERLKTASINLPSIVKAITVDGSYINVNCDIIGKKRL